MYLIDLMITTKESGISYMLLSNQLYTLTPNCYVDILSSQDLQNLKNKSSSANTNKQVSKSNKRYAILTYMTNDQKYHFPLSLTAINKEYSVAELK